MSAYRELLTIARQQALAAERGDLDQAVGALDERAALLEDVPEPTADDVAVIHEVLRLDQQISSAIGERMLQIRNEVLEGQHGQRALNGYGRRLPRRPVALDREG
jgi:hypothetical protein